jgi:lipoate-protein ligase A
MRIVTSETLDPFWNLAAESVILDLVDAWGPILMLWRGARSVVIGKNQNPWREVNLPALTRDEGLLARRVTGGGAVFHDEGNLNYSYFCHRQEYDFRQVLQWVQDAIASFGIDAEPYGKNGLGVGGKKISGNAFCYRKNSVLHHGTLLIDADLESMIEFLSPGAVSIETHAVDSVPAEVGNLCELQKSLSLVGIRERLISAFNTGHRDQESRLTVDDLEPEVMDAEHLKFLSWEWRFGRTPGFRFRTQWKEGNSTRSALFVLRRGIIEAVQYQGIDKPSGANPYDPLLGCRFLTGELTDHLPNVPEPAARAIREFLASNRIP